MRREHRQPVQPQAPPASTLHRIRKTCRDIIVSKSGRALQPPGIVAPNKTTGIVAEGVQSPPENRVITMTLSPLSVTVQGLNNPLPEV